MFISFYTTIYFFVKKNYFFQCLYFNEYDIQICFYTFFWLRKGPSVKYVRNWWEMERDIQNAYNCVQGECHASCVRTHLYYLVSCFRQHVCLIVPCLICRNLSFAQKRSFIRNSYFSPARSISVVMKEALFT